MYLIMNEVHLPEPILITRAGSLQRLVDKLSQERIVAVDTESNSLFAYQEQVCLIQFSTTQEDFLVDPLALADLTPLAPFFADPRIEKVFHAAEYDLITLKRDFDFAFENLFDTMLAARILGWDEMGLGAILKAEFGVQLDKRFQRANWGQRPLPPDLLAYARLDTHYLIPLRDQMRAELKATGRWSLAVEDFQRIKHVNGRDPSEMRDPCWRISGVHDLSPQQMAVLQEICRYRDQIAKTTNRPLFKVINDSALFAIAQASPTNPHELRKVPGLSPKIAHRYGEGLLRAVKRGLRADPVYPPRSPRPNEQYLARLEALRHWRKVTAQEMGVNSDVVLPRDLLFSIASQNPQQKDELARILNQVPWRLERFGDEIMVLLARV